MSSGPEYVRRGEEGIHLEAAQVELLLLRPQLLLLLAVSRESEGAGRWQRTEQQNTESVMHSAPSAN